MEKMFYLVVGGKIVSRGNKKDLEKTASRNGSAEQRREEGSHVIYSDRYGNSVAEIHPL